MVIEPAYEEQQSCTEKQAAGARLRHHQVQRRVRIRKTGRSGKNRISETARARNIRAAQPATRNARHADRQLEWRAVRETESDRDGRRATERSTHSGRVSAESPAVKRCSVQRG